MDPRAQRDAEKACLYPMYGVSVKAFLLMSGRPKPHQELLLQDGSLTRYHESLHFTFVSHQWVGCGFPDPEGIQLQVLRKALSSGFHVVSSLGDQMDRGFKGRKMPDTERRAVLDGILWVDFFGVPQIRERGGHAFVDAFKAAINSIPSYVRLCKTFVVLAPSMFHEDGSIVNFATYLSRGWCQMELLFWKITADAEAKSVVSLRGAGKMPLYEPSYVIAGLAPYTAAFTAEEDRKIVCEVLRGYLNSMIKKQVAIASEAEVGSKRWKRFMFSALTKATDVEFLCGPYHSSIGTFQQSSCVVDPQCPFTTFEQIYDQFDEAAARTHLGVSRVALAACAGKDDLLCTALKSADAGDICLLTKEKFDEATIVGFTPLPWAANWGRVACIKMLLEHRAEVNAKVTNQKWTPLGLASASKRACVETINVLLAARADIESCHLFLSAIQLAVIVDGSALKITRLLEARADVHRRGLLGAPLMFHAALNGSDPCGTVEVLVRARAEVDVQRGKQPCWDKAITAYAFTQDFLFGVRGEIKHKSSLHNGDSLTALHIAAYGGNWNVCAALIAHGASTETRVRGRTARDIAAVQGTEHIFQHLVEEGTVWV